MTKVIGRITLFKIPKEEDIEKVLAQYTNLTEKAKKNGSPYILWAKARRTYDDERNQGFNIVAQTKFATLEDMKFYDTECQAHQDLKTVVKPLQQGVCTMYWDDEETK